MMEERKRYSYYAFISYKREDERWAGWLQRQLENYRIPSVIRKQNINIPQKIYPVFRDKTDLTGGKILELLHKELEDSQYLIVICSPNSATSPWVSKEVQYFIDMGREDFIIPFIVEGQPFAQDPEKECFPEILRTGVESELLGISVKELGRRQAFLRVVATLLSLRFDQLVMRDQRRRRKRQRLCIILTMLFFMLAGAGIWYNVPHSEYYRLYTYQNEIPVGLGKLSMSERKRIAECFKIVTQRGKVIHLERVNPAGKPIQALGVEYLEDTPVIDFYYEDAKISRAEYSNDMGQSVLIKDYSSNLKAVDFQQSQDESQTVALGADQSDLTGAFASDDLYAGKSEITRHINTYDDNGYLVQVQFMRDNLNTPAKDNNGIYGRRYQRDQQGRIIKMTYLDDKGKPLASRQGIAGWVFKYSEMGVQIESHAFDLDGNVVRGEERYAFSKRTINKDGNVEEERYLDEKGNLCNTEMGYARLQLVYDDKGYLTERYQFDVNGDAAFDNELGVHGQQNKFDRKGNLSEISFYDSDKKLKVCGYGFAVVEYSYDEEGKMVMQRYRDTEGNAVCDRRYGCYSLAYNYDEAGHIVGITYLGEDGKPMVSREGIAMIIREYNESNQLVREEYRDENGELDCGKNNMAICEFMYDRKGNVQQVEYKGEDGKRCKSAWGYANVILEYDELGNQIKQSYFDDKDYPVISSEGYHSVEMQYDSQGNCTQKAFYNTEGNLIKLPEWYAVEKTSYDEYGKIVEQSYYDINGNNTNHKNGYGTLRIEYDRRGNCIWKGGYTHSSYNYIQYEYDANDQLIRESYLERVGEPGLDDNQISTYEYTYDEQGRQIKVSMLDREGEPEDVIGYTAKEKAYDENNFCIREIYYGSEGIIRQDLYTYDERGNQIVTAYQDEKGNPMKTEGGYAEFRAVYNALGDVVEGSFYDESGNLCRLPGGYAKYENVRDSMGNIVEVKYYDEEGNLAVTNSGYARGVREYNEQGWVLRDSFYDAQGKLIGNDNGNPSIVEYYYDESGRESMKIYYDRDGREISRTSGIVIMTEVREDGQAYQAGIRENDLLITCNQWHLFDFTDFIEAADALTLLCTEESLKEKELVVGRKIEPGEIEFFKVSLRGGMIGVRFLDENCTAADQEQIKQQYEVWIKGVER